MAIYYKGNQQQILIGEQEYNFTGNSTSFPANSAYHDIITFNYDPIKSGSRVRMQASIQSWWGSNSDGSGDVYVRFHQNSSGSYSQFHINSRATGNFDADSRRQHLTLHFFDAFTTSSSSQFQIRIQAMGSGGFGSQNFNFFHTSEGNVFPFKEYDIA